jgi:RNA polymerase sigma-70 factor (ECF subfamily)
MLPVAELNVNNEQLPTSLEGIFRENYRLIYRTAYHLTGNAQDAEDVLQTIFLRLLRNESTPDEQRNPKGYLYRAAVNVSLDLVRARRRHAPVDVERLLAPVPEERSFDDAVHQRLIEAIAELRPRAAQILVLHYVHGHSDAEIAQLLGTTRGTIAVSLFRTRLRLKKMIRAYLGEQS